MPDDPNPLDDLITKQRKVVSELQDAVLDRISKSDFREPGLALGNAIDKLKTLEWREQ
jgi:hypothetical protein